MQYMAWCRMHWQMKMMQEQLLRLANERSAPPVHTPAVARARRTAPPPRRISMDTPTTASRRYHHAQSIHHRPPVASSTPHNVPGRQPYVKMTRAADDGPESIHMGYVYTNMNTQIICVCSLLLRLSGLPPVLSISTHDLTGIFYYVQSCWFLAIARKLRNQ